MVCPISDITIFVLIRLYSSPASAVWAIFVPIFGNSLDRLFTGPTQQQPPFPGGKEVNDATKSIAAKVPKIFFAVQDISNSMVMVRSMVIKIFCSLFVYQKKSLPYLMV